MGSEAYASFSRIGYMRPVRLTADDIEFVLAAIGTVATVIGTGATILFGVIPLRRRRKVTGVHQRPELPVDRKSYLSRGDSLLVGESLYSPDGRTRFTLQEDANMVVVVDGLGAICDTGTANSGKPRCLTLQEDGWLVLYDVDDMQLWRKGPRGDHLNVQDNSHVILYPAIGIEPVWATRSFFKLGKLVDWIPLRARARFFDV